MPSNTNEPGTEDRSYAALDRDVDDLRRAQNLIRHVAYRRRLVTPAGVEQSKALDAIADCLYLFLFGLVPDEKEGAKRAAWMRVVCLACHGAGTCTLGGNAATRCEECGGSGRVAHAGGGSS